MRSMLDVTFARRQFPALSDDWALFDNAGGTVPLKGVIDRVHDYMSRWQVQLGASYHHSSTASELVEAGTQAMARLINAAPEEVVLGASTTMNVRVLAQALRPRLSPGDEIVVTNLDHESNIGAWRELESWGVKIREWRFDTDRHELMLADLEPLLNSRTRLVCFTQCANVMGTVHDAAAIVRRVHEAGALACVDGVAFAPHRRVDVRALDADFYLVSIYKVMGPHLGLLYGKREHLVAARGQNHFFIAEDDVPYKLQPGKVPHELAASLPAILDYLMALDERTFGADDASESQRLDRVFGAIAEYEASLAKPLLEFLRLRTGVQLLGRTSSDPAGRVATITFTVDGRDAGSIPERLDGERIGIRFGHFYAQRAIEALGLAARNGVVRISMVHYNTEAEVARLIEALDRVL